MTDNGNGKAPAIINGRKLQISLGAAAGALFLGLSWWAGNVQACAKGNTEEIYSLKERAAAYETRTETVDQRLGRIERKLDRLIEGRER